MLTDNNIYINSKILVGEIITTYNIQSTNFINKCPSWIIQAMGLIGYYQAYIDVRETGKFTGGIFKLRDIYKSIKSLKINGEEAFTRCYNEHVVKTDEFGYSVKTPTPPYFKDDVYTVDDSTRDFYSVGDYNISLKDEDIISGIVNEPTKQRPEPTELERLTEDPKSIYYRQTYGVQPRKHCQKPKPTFSESNGWIHVDVIKGEYDIIYRAIPFQYDSDIDMTFPLIYNDEILKECITNYILRQLLYSGYSHPILDLTADNEFVNPAMRFENTRRRARNNANKFTTHKRDEISKILTQLWL